MSKTCYLSINLFDYDVVSKPPVLPTDIVTIYFTDNVVNYNRAKSLGWNKVYRIVCVNNNTNFSKRCAFTKVKLFPELYIADIKNYDVIISVDSNVAQPPAQFDKFIASLQNQETFMVVDIDYYVGARNTIRAELERSLKSKRWAYNASAMKIHTQRYLAELQTMGITDAPVASAKYTAWRINHPKSEEIRNWLLAEYYKHLQGNIIYSFAAVLFKDYIKSTRILARRAKLIPHRKQF